MFVNSGSSSNSLNEQRGLFDKHQSQIVFLNTFESKSLTSAWKGIEDFYGRAGIGLEVQAYSGLDIVLLI